MAHEGATELAWDIKPAVETLARLGNVTEQKAAKDILTIIGLWSDIPVPMTTEQKVQFRKDWDARVKTSEEKYKASIAKVDTSISDADSEARTDDHYPGRGGW